MVFVDTWAWIALAVYRAQFHDVATIQHQDFLKQGRRYVTSNFVLSELITQLYLLSPASEARRFVDAIVAAVKDGDYTLVHVSTEQFENSLKLRRRYDDKPDISFVDFTSMVVMQELNITDIFTGDAHFEQVNLGFRLFP